MGVPLKKRVTVGKLHDPAEVHDSHAVTDLVDDIQIVGDEDIGERELSLEFLKKIQNLRLDRYIQRGNRLVADDELRLQRKSTRDADTLLLAAGKLMRVAAEMVFLHSDKLQKPQDPSVYIDTFLHSVDEEGFSQDLANGSAGVKTGGRILKDHLRLLAHLFQLPVLHSGKLFAFQHNTPVSGLDQSEHGTA